MKANFLLQNKELEAYYRINSQSLWGLSSRVEKPGLGSMQTPAQPKLNLEPFTTDQCVLQGVLFLFSSSANIAVTGAESRGNFSPSSIVFTEEIANGSIPVQPSVPCDQQNRAGQHLCLQTLCKR